jgi:ABC-type amino acid transport substrate-binding protein
MKKIAVVLTAVAIAAMFTGCAKKTQVKINGIADLEGKKIGVQTGTTGDTWCQESSKAKEIAGFKSGMDAALDLKNGAIDAIVLDELPALSIVSKNSDLKIIRDPYFSENKEEYAIAIKKGNDVLLNSINKTIADMKANGDYEKLVNAFMPADGEIKIPADVSPANASGTIKLGTNAAFPPFEYVEGTEFAGFDITMGQYIAKNLSNKLEVVNMEFDSLIPALQAGTIDFIAAGMSVTEERKKNVDFSDPYFASEQVIIVRK